MGWWVTTAPAAGGTQALELSRRLDPRVVVVDLQMPGMDGLVATRQLCRLLRQVGPDGTLGATHARGTHHPRARSPLPSGGSPDYGGSPDED